MTDIIIRYAASDQDVVAIHQFLCVVAGPSLPGAIDWKKSASEVWRVCANEFSLMAIKDGRLVGALGLVRADFWWGDVFFLANRWFFTLPGSRAGKPLLKEAKTIAREAGLECHIFSEALGKILILNRSPRRNSSVSNNHVSRQQSDAVDPEHQSDRVDEPANILSDPASPMAH